MEKEVVDNSINHYSLISSEKSREILKAIQQNISFETIFLPETINIHCIEKLKSLYQEKKMEIERLYKNGTCPANLPFYHILKEKYSTFSWKILEVENKPSFPPKVIIEAPRVKNQRLSLFSLLINDIDSNTDMALHRRYPCVANFSPAIVASLERVMKDIQVIYPEQSAMEGIVEWLQRGLQGEPLTLFSPVCPDYSVEKTKDKNNPYRYTFDNVGTEVGLIAHRILSVLPFLNKFFKENGINVTIVVGIGDFEALQESNLRRVGLSLEEFLHRVRESLKKIQETSEIEIETHMITEMCGGHEEWKKELKKVQEMFDVNNYGASKLNKEKLLEILKARKQLYSQWQGERHCLECYSPQLLMQGAEYAVLGTILKTRYKNCLLFGADHFVMGHFYKVQHPSLPLLYLKRSYC